MSNLRGLFQGMFVVLALLSQQALADSRGITFQAMLKRADGSTPTASSLAVNLKVLSPNGCVLRDEDFNGVNVSNGFLYLVVGKGSVNANDPGKTFKGIMSNSSSINNLKCLDSNNNVIATNQVYTPAIGDARKLRLSLVLESESIIADFNMRATAFAINSETLNGRSEIDFVQTNGSVTQSAIEGLLSNVSVGQLLAGTYNAPTASNVTGTVSVSHGGTGATTPATARTNLGLGALAVMNPTGTADSTTYLRGDGTWASMSSGGSVTSVAGRTGAVTITSSDVSGLGALATKSTSGTADNTTFLRGDGAWTTISATDSSKLPLAGGTMSGQIDMSSNSFVNAGYITMSNNRSLLLSNNSSDPTCAASDKGRMWFDSTGGQIKFCDGSSIRALGTSGPTVIANVATLPNGRIWIGDVGGKAQEQLISGDASLASNGTITITSGSINSAKVQDASILATDLNYTGVNTGNSSIALKDSSGKFYEFACNVDGQVVTWTVAGWTCQSLSFSSMALASGKILVGSGSNIATAQTLTGDASISNLGEISLANSGVTAGTYSKVVVDVKGRVTSGANISTSDITAALGFSPINSAGGSLTGALTLNATNEVRFADSDSSNYVGLKAPSNVTSNKIWVLPDSDGVAGQLLKTDGAGNLSWVNDATGGSPSDASYATKGIVRFLTDAATSGITVSAGVANINSGTSANQIVKLDGSAKLPTIDGSQLTNITTSIDKITSGAGKYFTYAPNNVACTNGQLLSKTTNGWECSNASSGTVTSITAGSGLTGGTINASGTIGLGTELSGINALSSTGVLQRSGAGAYSTISVNESASSSSLVRRDASGVSGFFGVGISGATSGTVSVVVPSVVTSYTLTLPAAQGTSGQVLANNGSGGMSWVSPVTNSLNAGRIFVGNASNIATAQTLTGDATLSSSGILTLANSGVSAGTFSKVTVDTKGRVTSGANLDANDIASVTGFINGGNSFGLSTILGTNDNNSLEFETNGVTQLKIASDGKIGINRAPSSTARVDVSGSVVSRTNIVTSGASVDLSLANNHLLKSVGGSVISLSNLTDGGAYTLIISDTTSRTYTFSGCTNSYFNPSNSATTANTQSTYTILVAVDGANTNCYISWMTGFQ